MINLLDINATKYNDLVEKLNQLKKSKKIISSEKYSLILFYFYYTTTRLHLLVLISTFFLFFYLMSFDSLNLVYTVCYSSLYFIVGTFWCNRNIKKAYNKKKSHLFLTSKIDKTHLNNSFFFFYVFPCGHIISSLLFVIEAYRTFNIIKKYNIKIAKKDKNKLSSISNVIKKNDILNTQSIDEIEFEISSIFNKLKSNKKFMNELTVNYNIVIKNTNYLPFIEGFKLNIINEDENIFSKYKTNKPLLLNY